ncbi:MAG: hypothetical protein M1381_11880 [Deltaproteobacteria bacterium]|nr:hypothetical protein [Deltaproteobacteria bacterium]
MAVDMKLVEWIKANRLKLSRAEMIQQCKAEGNAEQDVIDSYNEVVKLASHTGLGIPMPKEKTVAILLAVFLGFWTWVYTYQKDAGKFWGNLIFTVITFGIWGIVAWIWAIISAVTRPDEFYMNYPNG